ncbi:hypothetical protein [Pelagimonas varians]|uniref:Uncharacterized protein n=1 Tax=Pelagimonas varians TaxID=696760 RepID=A0A238L1A8_9RHOB|nr:hypothetical protein [Pelagimonas varians]PYG27527.1 hypothetical protein C8N36_1158 [Pelagimonas varians]SMX48106.1 hypothetical protein PEV8663_03740 [Pelagimonas varians]
MKIINKFALIAALATAFTFEIDPVSLASGTFGPQPVSAEIGRPLTPGSIAGVARRTNRRAMRRGAYYNSLPSATCVRATVYGYAVWDCGGRYYQSSGNGYVIVTF